MIVYDRLNAKPRAGVEKDKSSPECPVVELITSLKVVKLLYTDLVGGCREVWGRSCPSVDVAGTTVWTGPIWRTMNGLDAASAMLEGCRTIQPHT